MLFAGNNCQNSGRFNGGQDDPQSEVVSRFRTSIHVQLETYRSCTLLNEMCNDFKRAYAQAFTHSCMQEMLLSVSKNDAIGLHAKDVTLISHPFTMPTYRLAQNVIIYVHESQGVGARNNHELNVLFDMCIGLAYNCTIKLGSDRSKTTTRILFLDELNFMADRCKSFAAIDKACRLSLRKPEVYARIARGLLVVLDNVRHMQAGFSEYDDTGHQLLSRYIDATFTNDNCQVQFYTLHTWQGLEVDDFYWLERQNAPSMLALRYGDESPEMKQERHLEYIGLSRGKRKIKFFKKSSDTACRCDPVKLRQLLLPPVDGSSSDVDDGAPNAMDAASHLAQRADAMQAQQQLTFELQNALNVLMLPAMPANALELTTAHHKRLRDGSASVIERCS